MMTSYDNSGVSDDDMTTAEPVAVVVAPRHHHCRLSRPRWLQLVAPLPRPLDRHCLDVAWLGGGGQRTTTSLVDHVGRRSPLWSSSVVGRPNLCATHGASTSDDMDTMVEL
jgi:hypothetical protein